MWLTPSSTVRRNTAMARSRSPGAAPVTRARPVYGRRIAPNPIQLTVRSPSFQAPAAAAVTGAEVIAEALPVLADDEHGFAARDQFTDDRRSGQLSGHEQPARRLRVGEQEHV